MLRGWNVFSLNVFFTSSHLRTLLNQTNKWCIIGFLISFIYWFCLFSVQLSHTILPASEYSRPNLSKTWQVVKTVLKGWNDKHIDWMSAIWKNNNVNNNVIHSAEMMQLLQVPPTHIYFPHTQIKYTCFQRETLVFRACSSTSQENK